MGLRLREPVVGVAHARVPLASHRSAFEGLRGAPQHLRIGRDGGDVIAPEALCDDVHLSVRRPTGERLDELGALETARDGGE